MRHKVRSTIIFIMKNSHQTMLISMLLMMVGCSSNTGARLSTPFTASNKQLTHVIPLKSLPSLESITPALSQYRTVFVGETHTAYSDHLNQLAIIKNLHSVWKQTVSIGLEMVQQPFQAYLDGFVAGRISERDMLAGTQWYDRWVYDYRLYRPIFTYARDNHIPLVALNIPKELTHRITQVGIKGLSQTERKQLPNNIDRTDKGYIKRISAVFGRHGKTQSKGVDKFIDAQLGWDEGMAYAAARYLKQHPQQHLIILAGGGHVINGDGIPDRLDRMIGSQSAIVLNSVNGALSASQGDYLLDSPEHHLPPIGLIGIGMKDTPSGIKISVVSPKGAAKKAGLQTGDIILELDGKRMLNRVDLKTAMETKRPHERLSLLLKRGKKTLKKVVMLQGKSTSRIN